MRASQLLSDRARQSNIPRSSIEYRCSMCMIQFYTAKRIANHINEAHLVVEAEEISNQVLLKDMRENIVVRKAETLVEATADGIHMTGRMFECLLCSELFASSTLAVHHCTNQHNVQGVEVASKIMVKKAHWKNQAKIVVT